MHRNAPQIGGKPGERDKCSGVPDRRSGGAEHGTWSLRLSAMEALGSLYEAHATAALLEPVARSWGAVLGVVGCSAASLASPARQVSGAPLP